MATSKLAPTVSEKITPYDEFNIEIARDHFPVEGMSARAAQGLVNSFAWTDANPMLNLSSFVTTWAEPEAVEVARVNMYKNYIDHDMYPQVFKMEGQIVKWLHNLWNGPKNVETVWYGHDWFVRSLHAGWTRAQMELAPGPTKSR